jgi:hypothetical protein
MNSTRRRYLVKETRGSGIIVSSQLILYLCGWNKESKDMEAITMKRPTDDAD